ncbi:MAG: serine hydrolase, partial [Eudoraea sp.]
MLSIGAIIQATTPETITKKVEYTDNYYTPSAQEKTIYNLKRQELQLAVQKYFKKAIASGTIVGAGVSIVRNDSILLNDGFGRRNFNLDKKVDGETIFRL